jgi:hypothetical protein
LPSSCIFPFLPLHMVAERVWDSRFDTVALVRPGEAYDLLLVAAAAAAAAWAA